MTGLRYSILGACALLLAAAAPSAGAATRYASPTGTGAPSSCPQSSPCSLSNAVNGLGVAGGDVIRVLSGSYDLGGVTVGVNDTLTIEGEPGAPTPLIQNAGDTSFSVQASAAGTVIRNLRISVNGNPGSDALHVNSGGAATFERLQVTATGAISAAVQLEGTMRDSVVDFRGSTGGAGILTCCAGGATIENVTSVASATGSYGIAVYDSFGDTQTANIRNTIARGPGGGIRVAGSSDGGLVTANVSNSNHDGTLVMGTDAALNLGAGLQTGAPSFADASGGDYRQLPGSVTIDAGDPAGVSGADLEGQPRTQGSAPDIGADEAPDGNSLLGFGDVGRLKRSKKLRIPVTCPDLNCNLAAAGRLVLKGSAASASKVVALKTVNASLTAGQPGTIVFKLKKGALRKLRAAKKAKLNVTASVIEALGFTGTEQGSFRFKPAKKKKKK